MRELHMCYEQGCHRLVPKGTDYCSLHAPLHPKRERDKYVDRHYNDQRKHTARIKFYHSKEWSTLRQAVLSRDNHLCQYCLVHGNVTVGNIVDHIVPALYDPLLSKDGHNLVTCCRLCHQHKTDWEYSYYFMDDHKALNPDAVEINDVPLLDKLIKKINLSAEN
ncbi:HNH endonuclease [Oenococcus sp.]|uniref:HNH endonuclease n=1 Tax=Oenococcus sp. TaxID=1979414 RepID=UPI0039E82CA1